MCLAILPSPIFFNALITSVHDADGHFLSHKSKSPVFRLSTPLKSAAILLASVELSFGR